MQQIVSDNQEPTQDTTTIPGVTSIGDKAMIVRGRDEISKLLDASRIMSGQKTTDQMKEELKQTDEEKKEDIHQNKVSLPAELFSDFKLVNNDNENDFEYIAGQFIVQFLEKFNDKALEFPSCLDGGARAVIHRLCNFLGICSHSTGKGPTRKILIYPRHLFQKKQEAERLRIEKEKDKLRQKFKDFPFAGTPNENPITMREKLIREIYFEQRGLKDEQKEEVWDGPIEVKITELKKKFKVYESNLEKLKERYEQEKAKETQVSNKFEETMTEDQDGDQKRKPKVIKYVGNTKPQEPLMNQQTVASNNDTQQDNENEDMEDETQQNEQDEEYQMMDEEQKKDFKEKQERIKKQKQQDFQKVEEFHKQLKQFTLQSFKDRPEEIKTIRCVHAEGDKVVLEWEPPSDNNCPITQYHIYLSTITVSQKHKFQGEVNQNSFERIGSIPVTEKQEFYEYVIENLESGIGYYVLVTAENDLGEGYRAQPFMIRTTKPLNEAYSLYSWGNNANSELGLSDEQVNANNNSYVNHAMKKILRNEMFINGGIIQAAPGNASTIFIYKDNGSNYCSILQSGSTILPKNQEDERTVFHKSEVEQLEFIPSVPFQIDFNIPVYKVTCGDLFAGLLTIEGEVFTWGYNIYGQLGLKDSSIGVTLSPQKVTFPNPKDRIIDIQAGFNQCLALTDSKSVYVWGRRMGVYPQFELNYYGVLASANDQIKELNQEEPRLLKGNLIYYKINKLCTGPLNSALISENGELLIQGLNENGQLALGEEFKNLFFFSEFMKKDFFSLKNLEVLDAQFGIFHLLVLCKDKATQQNRLFGCGQTQFGQLGFYSELTYYDFIEVTDKLPQEIIQISCGSFHTLFLTKDNVLYGSGKNSKGQLGFKTKGKKYEGNPVQIKMPNEQSQIMDIKCGSLFSMALCKDQ